MSRKRAINGWKTATSYQNDYTEDMEKRKSRRSLLNLNKHLLTYGQAHKGGAKQVGAKAFNIARCNEAGFPVQDGVILSFETLRANHNGAKFRMFFSSIEGYFAGTRRIIVRSSALQEDTAEASFAGQYLSLICTNRATEIKKACEACWASYSSSNVTAYHKAMKGSVYRQENGMGLLIQRMVTASSSGVCFTKDPLKSQKGVFIINAVHGLASSLMAGEVVADQYQFDIRTGKLINSIKGKQAHWRSPESPQLLSPLPQQLLGKPVLTARQVEEVSRMAHRATELFQNELDIEWAYEGEKLFLLQVRPITPVAKKREFELWTRDNVADVIPDAVTPLTWSVVQEATNNGFKKAIRELGFPSKPNDLFKIFDGRVYCSQTAYQKFLDISPQRKRNPRFLIKVGVNYLSLLSSLKKQVAHLEDRFWEGLNTISAYPGASAISELKNYLDKYMTIHIRIAMLMELGFLFIRKVIRKYMSENEANTIADGLVTGMNEVESTASAEALWELACLIKDNKELTETIMNGPDKSIPDTLITWGGIYAKKWHQFLDHYGHSSLKEFEIYYPRWVQDPSFITATLKQYVLKGETIDPETKKRLRAEKRMESERMLLKRIPLMYHLPLKFHINHVRRCSIWRESIKQKLVRIMAEIRKQALVFADENAIDPIENVFFLTLEEISQLEDNSIPSELLVKITTRKKNWEKWGKQEPFKEIRVYADGRQIKVPYLTGTGNHLYGLPLSSGKYVGPARVILDPNKKMDSLNFGDILVTRSTNPSWTPLFTLAGAIVTDMGNYLSHGAIVARELGIPAVGNLLDATTRITDGQMVEVDGDSGIVILSGQR